MTETLPHELIVENIRNGVSCFLTGPGGTGKTYNTNRALEELKDLRIIRTATTGVAALNIENGRTVHSAFMLPVNDVPDGKQWIKKSKRLTHSDNPRVITMLEQARLSHVLMIDEISMLSAWLFEMLDIRLRVWRECNKPFGGITLFLVGDFLQLAPVYNEQQQPRPHPRSKLYAFESPLWQAANIHTIALTKVFRQKNERFISICNRLRVGGNLSLEDTKHLRSLNYKDPDPMAVKIMVRRNDVFKTNAEALEQLDTAMVTVRFPVSSEGDEEMRKALWKDVRQGLYIPWGKNDQQFKVGARVMLTVNTVAEGVNTSTTYVNGDRGTVIGFRIGRFATNTLVPDDDLGLLTGPPGQVPVVLWDRTGTITRVNPHCFERSTKTADDVIKESAKIRAFPLCLAWSCTVHKCQGSTLSGPVHIDCRLMDIIPASFYVAISRATDLDNVTMSAFRKEGCCYPKALQFYEGTFTMSQSGPKILQAISDHVSESQEDLDTQLAPLKEELNVQYENCKRKDKFLEWMKAWVVSQVKKRRSIEQT